MGGFKPRFEGVPEDYYPASACDIILMVLFVTVIAVGGCGVLIGFLYWEFARGISEFVLVWSIVLIVFVALMFVAIFVGGRSRIKAERQMIQQKLADEKQRLEDEKRNNKEK